MQQNQLLSVDQNGVAPGKAKKQAGGVRSLADVAKDSEEDSDEDEGNEYYAGGEKRSAAATKPNPGRFACALSAHSDLFLLHDLQWAGCERRPQEQGVLSCSGNLLHSSVTVYLLHKACS